MIIKSKRIVLQNQIMNGYIVVENGIIQSIEPVNAGLKEDLDVKEKMIIPGIIDTHNHGTMGYSLMKDASENEIKKYLKSLTSQGVTSVFPTCDISIISKVAALAKQDILGAQIVGIHSEGPWLNRVGEKGIKTGWPKVDAEVAKKMIRDGQGMLKLVAIAPEIPGADQLMNIFKDAGVTLAMAHTDMNYRQANEAVENGISVATHLCNVMTGLHHRDIGTLGASLLNDKVYCELICDGLHVSLPMIQLILKVKNHNQIFMISDCTPLSGAPVGRYKGFGPGMEYINVTEDGFVLSDEGRLCGSSQGVIYGMKNLVNKLGISIVDVAKMSALNIANFYNIKNKGSLDVGNDADFVIIDDDFNVLQTYCRGKKVFDKNEDKDIFNPNFKKEFVLA